ncbi:uncharacterized protein [Diadema antillarum]|uniref:uncharacterized protein n=1 Tax=Diadema antillarum TaxID=105358 RepID=UPI003A892EC2
MATFHQISSQNLECPICLTLFNQPKTLTCSHTFCKDCLESIVQTQPNQQTIKCPVCREGTLVPSGDVSKLQTNIPLSSLVDEVKTKSETCTICEMYEKQPAVSYCQDCKTNLCKTCEADHVTWKAFSNHEVVPMSEVLSGKASLRTRRKLNTGSIGAYEDCFCFHCREYISHSCEMLEHIQAAHQLEKASIHEEKLMKYVSELRERVKTKKKTIEDHLQVIETQRNEITNMMRRLNDDIDKTYEEYMQLLTDRRVALKCQVNRWSDKFEKELQTMEDESRQSVNQMNAMAELVTNGMKVPLEKDALIAHETLCENLKSFLGRGDPEDQSPRGVTERAQKISFCRYVEVNELCLGELKSCVVKADVDLPVKNGMNCMTRAPDGKMAVVSCKDGVHLYSPDGELQQTVLKDVDVRRIGFLTDGRSVVSNGHNKISLYTPRWRKLDVTFETMSDDGWLGGLTVDRDDNIYVSYRIPKKIRVYTTHGGKAIREIMCDRYVPQQLFSFHTTGKLLLTDGYSVVCLDGYGEKENVMKREGMTAFPAVCRDDSIIVAWVKHKEGLVNIDRIFEARAQYRHLFQDPKTREKRLVLSTRV